MPYNKRYKCDSSELRVTTLFSKSVHPGLDLVRRDNKRGVPLYAICNGVVVDAPIWNKTPTGAFGGNASGTYVAVRADGNGDNDYLVDKVGHLRELVVSNGQHVVDGQLIGYQGWTGYVIPATPDGEHTHNAMFRVINGVLDPPNYIDPTPYLEGASMIINPVPQKEEEMVTIPATQYKYISSRGNYRKEPRVAPETLTGRYIMPGDIVNVTAWQKTETHTWAKTGDVWFAAYEGETPWIEAVTVGDNSQSLLEKIAGLENQAIALEHNFVKAQEESGRLGLIIDGAKLKLDEK